MVPKKNAIWEHFKPRKLGPRASGSTILGFEPSPEKKHDVQIVLDSHFKSFVSSIRRRQGF